MNYFITLIPMKHYSKVILLDILSVLLYLLKQLIYLKGPEPYMEEYELGLRLSDALETAGFKDISQQDYSYFESIFLATK